MNKSGNWLRCLTNSLTDIIIEKAAQVLTKSDFIDVAIGIVTWGAADLMSRQQQWWNDFAMMILRRQIREVKLTITPSGKDYPKIYRKLIRY